MDDCVIEIDNATGQMTVLEGGELIPSIWDTGKKLQAFDPASGHRYMLSVNNDSLVPRRVTVH